jgi:hypothetical protein
MYVLATLAISSLIITPFVIPYFEMSSMYGVVRTLSEVQALSGSPQDYLAATDTNFMWGSITEAARSYRWGRSEHILFPGALAALLMLVGLAGAGGGGARGGLGRRYFCALAAFSAVMTLGPTWRAGGPLADLPMPYLALYEFVPGFKGLRVPIRFYVLVIFAIAVLAGYGVRNVRAWLRRSGSLSSLAGPPSALLTLAVLAEYAAFGFPIVSVPTDGSVPPIYRWLAEQDPHTVSLELPADKWSDLYYDYFSAYHWRRQVNGWSGFIPPAYPDIMRELEPFPSPSSVELARQLGVDVILIHPEKYPTRRWRDIERQLATASGLTLVGQFGGDYAYRVEKTAATVERVLSEGAIPRLAERGKSATVLVPLAALNSSGSDRALGPGPGATIRERWTSISGELRLREHRALLVPSAGDIRAVPIEVSVPDAAGRYALMLHLESAEAAVDLEGFVEVVDALETSKGASGHAARIELCSVPDTVKRRADVLFQCRVTNSGDSLWLARTPEGTGSVGLGITSWRRADGRPGLGDDGQPLSAGSELNRALWPGQTRVLNGLARAPTEPGNYTVHLDVFGEAGAWFGNLGTSSPVELSVRVER